MEPPPAAPLPISTRYLVRSLDANSKKELRGRSLQVPGTNYRSTTTTCPVHREFTSRLWSKLLCCFTTCFGYRASLDMQGMRVILCLFRHITLHFIWEQKSGSYQAIFSLK